MRISDWSSDVCSSDLRRSPLMVVIGLGCDEVVLDPTVVAFKAPHRTIPATELCQIPLSVRVLRSGVGGNRYLAGAARRGPVREIGRAPCRARVCQSV